MRVGKSYDMNKILVNDIRKIFVLLLFVGCISTGEHHSFSELGRPTEWAQPISNSSLKNLHRVTDKIYRSEQPNSEGMKELEKLGIREVLNLRNWHSDNDEAKGTKLKLHRVKMETGSICDDEVIAAMRIINDSEEPILIHCHYGADRSGLVCAMYRILYQEWSKEAAIDEMKKGGFGFHSIWWQVPEYIQDADIESLKSEIEGSVTTVR